MVIGLVIGIPISIACGHLIAAHLFQAKSWDPLVLTGSSRAGTLRTLGQRHSSAACGIY